MRISQQTKSINESFVIRAERLAQQRGFAPVYIDTGSAWVLSVWDCGVLRLESTLLYSGVCSTKTFDINGTVTSYTTGMPEGAVDLLGWAEINGKIK